MPGRSQLAFVVIWCAVCCVDTSDRLAAQEVWDDPLPVPLAAAETPDELYWRDSRSGEFLRRLPPLEEEEPYDTVPPLERPSRDGRPAPGIGGNSRTPFTARLSWTPRRDLKNQASDLAVVSEELDIAIPIVIAPEGMWMALGSVQSVQISSSAIFPDSGLPVPDQLWDLEAGTMYLRSWENDWRSCVMFQVGSPSDRPFGALRDMTVTFLGFLTIPRGQRDAWNLSLFYSPTGQIVFPIPGVAYVWRPTDQFQANIGIPLSVEYHPTEAWTLTASYQPLTNVQVLARRALGERWNVYGGYRTMNETYLLADRVDDQQRTYVFDQRVLLGVERSIGRGWSLDFSVGYAFDRQIFQAEKFSGSRSDELAIDPGVVGTLQLLWTR